MSICSNPNYDLIFGKVKVVAKVHPKICIIDNKFILKNMKLKVEFI